MHSDPPHTKRERVRGLGVVVGRRCRRQHERAQRQLRPNRAAQSAPNHQIGAANGISRGVVATAGPRQISGNRCAVGRSRTSDAQIRLRLAFAELVLQGLPVQAAPYGQPLARNPPQLVWRRDC